MPAKIGTVFDIAYPTVLKEFAKLGHKSWPSIELENLYQEDRLDIIEEVKNWNEWDSMSVISTPIMWTSYDEFVNDTIEKRLDLVKSLLENGIRSHNDQILECLLEYKKMIFPQHHRYLLSNIEVGNKQMYGRRIQSRFIGQK